MVPWTVDIQACLYGIFQARILEWVAISSSRGFSQPRDQTCAFCIAGGFFTAEPPAKPRRKCKGLQGELYCLCQVFLINYLPELYL